MVGSAGRPSRCTTPAGKRSCRSPWAAGNPGTRAAIDDDNGGMELTDGRIVLRTPTEDDAAPVAAAVQSSLAELRPWMPWATEDYDEVGARQWINGEIEPGALALVILDEDNRIVGTTGLNHFDEPNRRANLGYWIRTDATGRGYATAATRLVAAHGLAARRLERIEIIMSVENEASRRVAERAGALYEGVLRARLRLEDRQHDVHSYAILANPPV